MAVSPHVSRVRSLYKRILVLHRFLPLDLRALGDQYVKDEFRRHKGASAAEVTAFMTEWQRYKDTLQTQVLESAGARPPPASASAAAAASAASASAAASASGSVKFGADLTEGTISQFQEDQIGQLYELMLESTKPNRQFHIQED